MIDTNECARVFERLVEDPEAASADPGVAAHLGSCLDCFRVLTDLRDAPRMADLMRRQADGDPAADRSPARDPDPGPAFWSALATRTVVAVEAARATTATPVRATSWRAWAHDLGRRPGAMLFGAAAAAALIGVLGGWPSRLRAPTVPPATTASNEPDEIGGADGLDDVGAAGDVSALEAPELRRLLDGLRQGEPDEISAWYGAGADDEAALADGISGLDAPALKRLARALGGSTL